MVTAPERSSSPRALRPLSAEARRLDGLERRLGQRPGVPAGPRYTETDLAQAFYGRILASRLEADADRRLLRRVAHTLSQPPHPRVGASAELQRLAAQPPATLRRRLLTLLRSRSDRAQLLRSVIPWTRLLEPVELAAAQVQGRLLAATHDGSLPRQSF